MSGMGVLPEQCSLLPWWLCQLLPSSHCMWQWAMPKLLSRTLHRVHYHFCYYGFFSCIWIWSENMFCLKNRKLVLYIPRHFDTHNFHIVEPFPASYGAAWATGLWTGLLLQADLPPKASTAVLWVSKAPTQCVCRGRGFLKPLNKKALEMLTF